MSLFGVELNSQINRLITQVRLQLNKHKFVPNIRTLYRSFAAYDPKISGILSTHKFQKALGQNGLFFKQFEFQIFEKAFGNEKGKIGWFQFLQLVKQPLNQKRRQLILNIFEYLNSKYQHLNPENILSEFNPQGIQIFDSGKVTKEYIQQQLISLLSLPEGYLTKDEFVAFYDDLSVNFPHDQSFVKYISKQWIFTPESNEVITEEALKSIIKALRFKLIQKSKGTNDQFLMKKLFNQFDENKNGYISPFELDLMLKRLELPINEQAIQPLFRKLDKNNSGNIEYDEFKRFIFFDSFPV